MDNTKTIVPPLKIVYVTTWFRDTKFSQDLKFNKRACPIPNDYEIQYEGDDNWCTLTSSTEDMENAAGLIFHAPDTSLSNLPDRISNQPWILESLETPYSSSFRAQPEHMKNFDYLASYHFKSSFLFSYFSPAIMDVVNRPLPENFMETKTKSAPILWIAKNCGATNSREAYIKKLMEYVDVHSYGSCLNTKPFPSDRSRMDLIGEYKFYLAIENSNCEDYATEKLFDTLMMSAVPIVDGPPSYEGYIPNNRSVIHMDAYPDPKDLADYINYLHNNDTAYLEYLSFRKHSIDIAPKDRLDKAFLDNWSDPSKHNKRSSYCSVCRGLLPWWSYKSDPNQNATYRDPNKDELFLTDQSCAAGGKWRYILDGPPYIPDWTPRPRDEFTRPDFYDSAANMTTLPENTENDNNTKVVMGNILFISFFIAFIAFLFRQSRRHSPVYSQVPPV